MTKPDLHNTWRRVIMSNLFPQIFNPKHLKRAHKNKLDLECFCPYCRKFNHSHKAHKFANCISLFFHLWQNHGDEPDLEFILQVLKNVSYASQIKMIR